MAIQLSRRHLLQNLTRGAGGIALGVAARSAWGSEAALKAVLPNKEGLTLLNDRPINAETPAHLLDDLTTPAKYMFVRNNGHPPIDIDAAEWRVEIKGESCVRPQSFSIDELKSLFKSYSYDLQLECGGNGRSEFRPRASGNQWTTGAIACPNWTGVRLRDVLEYCGVKEDAVYVAYRGGDRHLSGADKEVISRGVPLRKALEPEALIAYAMNGEPIPVMHGAPLRMVVGGWPGSVSGKWLTEILVRNQIHDGAKMTGNSYRVPCESVPPAAEVPDEKMCIIESMPVKSLVTYPRSGVSLPVGQKQVVRGHAWAGDLKVVKVEISIDFGATWQSTELAAPRNRLAWQHWQTELRLPKSGYFEVWAKATDELGRSQPMIVPGWNPKGYLNNAAHRIALHAV